MPYLLKFLLITLFAILSIVYYCFNEEFHYFSYFYLPDLNNKQLILGRDKCAKKQFEDAQVIEVNNWTHPNIPWTHKQSEDVCTGKNREKCLPESVQIEERPDYFTANSTKTVHCIVRKNMSRVFKLLACLLNDPVSFFNEEKDLIQDAFYSRCNKEEQNRYRSIQNISELYDISNENGWKFVMIVREPLERFISGYIYVCLRGRLLGCTRYCNQCKANLTCYMEKHAEKMEKMAKDGKKVGFGLDHLYPQSWTCDLHSNRQNFTLLYYNKNSHLFFDQQLGPFLKSRNVSTQILSYIRERLTSTRTRHSNTNVGLARFLEERVKSSPYLLEKFMQLYYQDYKMFNYTLPKLIV